jgi:glutamate 5-kinase
VAVVKLGSSIVADETGAVRLDTVERLCAETAALHRAGEQVVIVTSGAIARGMDVMGLALRPRAMDELQAASAVGQGKLFRVYDELLQSHGAPSAQVLLTFFDMSARSHYLNARQTLRKLLDWNVVPRWRSCWTPTCFFCSPTPTGSIPPIRAAIRRPGTCPR